MLSLRVVNGSWMRLPFLFSMRFSHDLSRPFRKWNICIHSSQLSYYLFLLYDFAGIQYPRLENSHRALWCCRRVIRRNGTALTSNDHWHRGTYFTFPSKFPKLPIYSCRFLPSEVSSTYFSGIFFGGHCVKEIIEISTDSADAIKRLSRYIPLVLIFFSFFTFDRSDPFY